MTVALDVGVVRALADALEAEVDCFGWGEVTLPRARRLGNANVFKAVEWLADVRGRRVLVDVWDGSLFVRFGTGEAGVFPRRET